MKRIIFIIVFALLTAYTLPLNAETHILGDANDVVVISQLQPHFKRFVKLMKDNNVPVDYSLIGGVDLLPLSYGIQGLYSPTTHVVSISYYIQFPPYAKLTKQEKDDFVLIVLAHEIGHAMGWKHIDKETIGLMHPTSAHDLGIIRGSLGAEQYILNTFKYHLVKK